MATLQFFSFVVAVLFLLQCCSCVAFDTHALPNQLRSGAGMASSSFNADRRRTEIDTFSLDGFLDEEEENGDDDEAVNTNVDNADATEKVVDEIVDLLQRNAQQRDTGDETREPSDFPTGIPETDEPTPSPTSPVLVPTDDPTPVSTDDPTPEPTEEPTSVPTSTPTSTPTLVPTTGTDEPTNELTAFRYEEDDGAGHDESSNAPTALPSLIAPTTSPTVAGTDSSNNATVLLPRVAGPANSSAIATNNSSTLTDEPTTAIPTNMPTSSPTPNPSSSPTTASPTFSPTPACHDKRTYRSPINGLGCEQHVGSDCERWRHIGLTKEQVVELHKECPVACGTDCEKYTMPPTAAPTAVPTASPTHSLKNVVAYLELYMYGASGPMPIDTRRNLGEALQRYFEAKLDASDATGSSNMTSVTIADQGAIGGTNEAPVIVAKERSNRMMRKRRRMEDEKLNLKVKIIAEATTRHLDSAMFKALLQGAINDVETLSSVLLEADDYFAGVMMSNDMIEELNRAEGEATKPEENKTPTAAIVVSSIGVIAVGGFLTGHFLFRRHYDDRKAQKNNIHAFFTFSPKEGYIPDEEGGFQPNLTDLKGSGSIFSFEESPVHRLPENDPTMKAPGLLGSRSQSTASGSESNSGSNPSLPKKMADDQAIIVSPPSSPENLMAGIPPMIVIDNIDQAENVADNEDNENGVSPQTTMNASKSQSPKRKSNLPKADKNGMPIRRIEASSAIAKALSNNGNGGDSEVAGSTKEPTLMEMIQSVKSIEDEDEGDVRSPASSSHQCLSPTFERLWNDGDSVSSMPDVAVVNINLDQTRLKKSHSTDEVRDVEPSKTLNAFIQKEWANLGLSPTSQQKTGDQDTMSDTSVGPTYHQNLFASDSDIESGPAPAEQPTRHVRKDSKLKSFVSSLTHFSNHSRDSSRLSGSSSPGKLSPRKRDLEAVEEATRVYTEQAASIASSDYGSEARDTFDYDARPGLFSMSMARFERKMNKIGQKYQSKRDDAWKINTGAGTSIDHDERNAIVQRAMGRQNSDSSRGSENVLAIPQLAPHSPVRQKTDMKTSSSLSPKAPPPAITASNLRRSKNAVADGFEYVFEAPSNGKLGIIIHKTVVHTVKDYSPLFGMVEPGDRILQIDDIITDNMSTGEVTRVLTSKRTGKNRNNCIRLRILSSTEKKGLKTSDEESIVVPAAFVKKAKQVTINTDAPVSTFIYTNRTGSSEDDEVDDNSHLTSEQSTPQHSDFGDDDGNGDAGFHLLGACARSEDEEDEDVAIHLLGYSSGAFGEEGGKARMNLEDRSREDKEQAHDFTTEAEQRAVAEEETSVGDHEEERSFNHMIIMDAGSDESEGSSVDFEDFR